MKVLISSINNVDYSEEMEVKELSYYDAKFSMPCVMGDDWFQRIYSDFDFIPLVVRNTENVLFIVFEHLKQCEAFEAWLLDAEETVKESFRTMRG